VAGPPGAHIHHGHADEDHGRSPREQAEGPLAPTRGASVVLDIGPHAGALVVYAPRDLAGAEIEIRSGDGTWDGTHTAVRARHVGRGTVYAGVFGSLAPGPYEVRVREDAAHAGAPTAGLGSRVAQVEAGTVAESTLAPGTPPWPPAVR